MGTNFHQCSQTRYVIIALLAAIVGGMPAVINYVMDPFEMFRSGTLDNRQKELIEKSHYPLWKMTHDPGNSETVILGDSRARALRDKYWAEGGRKNVYNFAYGGGTIPELYETFKYVTKNKSLKTLVVGIQLRSFDERHKKGMNRVPEAVRVGTNSVAYLKNWFVTKTSWTLLKKKFPAIARISSDIASALMPAAHAAAPDRKKNLTFEELLRPENCFACELPEGGDQVDTSLHRAKGANLGLGRRKHHWDRFTKFKLGRRQLPAKFTGQIRKNSKSDWAKFVFSEKYWKMIEEIGTWGKAMPDRQVIFVIPPTITEMQATITQFGLQDLNEQLRKRLAKLALVLDFDFANDMTSDVNNFMDAYHFNPSFSRRIVRETLLMMEPGQKPKKKRLSKRKRVQCPIFTPNRVRRTKVGKIVMKEGVSCRSWEVKKNG